MPLPDEPGRGCFRDLVVVGKDVFVVKKDDQRSGVETRGTVSRHLTNSPYHPRGIKVMLTSGQVGRCHSGCGEPPAYGRLNICGELARFSTTTGRTASTCGKLSTAVVQVFLPKS
eukprot:scaffold11078_cov48-Attheya_sp.AAC.8